MMRKVLDTRSVGGHYKADMILFWCFDARFMGLLLSFLRRFPKKKGIVPVDLVNIAGGVHALASGSASERKFALSQIAASIKLHHTERIGLMAHIGCGKYGGSEKFKNHQAETDHHVKELKAAEKIIKKNFSQLRVDLYLADFDGLYKI